MVVEIINHFNMKIQDKRRQVGLQLAFIQVQHLQGNADLMKCYWAASKKGTKGQEVLDMTMAGRGQSILPCTLPYVDVGGI